MTPLHYACLQGQLDIVKMLTAAGAKVNAMDQMRVCYFLIAHQVIMPSLVEILSLTIS